MTDSKKVWAWVGVAVVVVVAIVWIAWATMPKAPVASGPAPVYAPQGQLVSQFPKDLILDTNAAVGGSYSIAYSTSTNQYTAEYDSSSSMATLFGDYEAYLSNSNWQLTGSLTTQPTYEVLTATQGADQLQVVIESEGSGSHATITYLVK
ncbi:MAG TPA: hypothetical protein VMA75_04540 [Candidatus Paceibacterota bacterium]|nr:hypothetical protein [Candidatus Paceibacterota bacterium]